MIHIKQSFQREDIYEFENGEINKTGSHTVETILKTPKSKRQMPMSKGVYNILLYINRINRLRGISVAPGSFVFINTLGNPIVGDCLRGRLDDLLKRHDLQGVSLHRFRHTFATRLFEAKVEMRYIQELLGHSNISMTQRYVHPNEEDKKDKIEQLEAYYSQQLGFSVGL